MRSKFSGLTRVQINKKANQELKKLYKSKGVWRCEVCGQNWSMSFAHAHKRSWYYDKPDELLWDFNQTLLLCMKHHDDIEWDEEKCRDLFIKLRGQ